jgi:type II secretory ATPase GspE/PulE/Tfp pilus assembly ATPase PilB-like protein
MFDSRRLPKKRDGLHDVSFYISKKGGGMENDDFLVRCQQHLRTLNSLIREAKKGIGLVPKKIVLELIALALYRRATDVHISVGGKAISLRENGKLISLDLGALNRELLESVIRHLVSLAEARNATTVNQFHQGSFVITVPNGQGSIEVSCRISVIPFAQGQSADIRLRSLEKLPLFSQLGLSEEIEKKLRLWVIERYIQGGVVVVTGPTGSGKSTTMLSLLWEVFEKAGREIAIGTIEDPVEIIVPGFQQLEVSAFGDISWETALLHFLRHDLDAVLVGEIRDEVIAEKALEIAMTGHLVFTTLHTSGALQAITRLRGLGISGNILAEQLIAIISQRLLHGLCPECKKECFMSEKDYRYLESKGYGNVRTFEISEGGCKECDYSGVSEGKIPIVELFLNTPEAKKEFIDEGVLEKFEVVAGKQGMRTMLEDALEKVADGILSFEEVRLVLITPQDYEDNS